MSGAAAVFASHYWINARADSRMQEIEANHKPAEFNTLVIADSGLRYGAVLGSSNLREIPWPSDAMPAGAFRSVDDVLNHGRRVVLSPMEANEPILATKITGPGQRASLSSIISDGMGAITIRVNDVGGVAGFVLPGDRVDLLLTRKKISKGVGSTDIILRGVRVLAVDQTADERQDTPTVVDAVTLEVSDFDAQKVALAQSIGTLSLMLRQAGNMRAAQSRRVTLSDLAAGAAVSTHDETPQAAEPARRLATIYVYSVEGRAEHLVPREAANVTQ